VAEGPPDAPTSIDIDEMQRAFLRQTLAGLGVLDKLVGERNFSSAIRRDFRHRALSGEWQLTIDLQLSSTLRDCCFGPLYAAKINSIGDKLLCYSASGVSEQKQ
jgi:hypothetical protein